MRGKKVRTIASFLLAVLAAAALYAIYRNGGAWLVSIENHRWSLDIPRLAVSALLLAFTLALTPRGWIMICRGMGSDIEASQLYAAWFASQLGRYVPGKVWLFAGRAGFLKAKGMKASRALATTAYELFFTIASVGLISLLSVLLRPDLLSGGAAKTAFTAAAAAVLLLPLLHPVQKILCRKKGISVDSLPSRSDTIKITLFYAVLWMGRGISLYLLLTGAGIDITEPARALAAAPLSWLAGYIVIVVPGGVGIREAAAAAIAAPEAVAPAALALAGQRVFMALAELLLALFTSKKIIHAGGTNAAER